MIINIYGQDERLLYAKEYIEQMYMLDTFPGNILLAGPKNNEEELIEYIKGSDNQILFTGCCSNTLEAFAYTSDIMLYKYLDDEEVVKGNAKLTARGLLDYIKSDLVEESDFTQINILVLGYGNCAKAIIEELKLYEIYPTVSCRNIIYKNDIELNDCDYINLSDLKKTGIKKYDVIINTIPAKVLNEDIIKLLSDKCKIYDIASAPGGVDFDKCHEMNIKADLYLGIPGKKMPKEAGVLIGEYVIKILNNYYRG